MVDKTLVTELNSNWLIPKKLIYWFTLLKRPGMAGLGMPGSQVELMSLEIVLTFSTPLSLSSPVALLLWWRQDGCQQPQPPPALPETSAEREELIPNWRQPEFWNWASVPLPVWGHVPIPEPTNVAWGCSALTGSGVRNGVSSSQTAGQSPRKIWMLFFFFLQKGGLRSGQAIITDVFYGSPVPFLSPTFYKLFLVLPAHLLSPHLIKMHLSHITRPVPLLALLSADTVGSVFLCLVREMPSKGTV